MIGMGEAGLGCNRLVASIQETGETRIDQRKQALR